MKKDTFKTAIVSITLLIILMIFADKGYDFYMYNYPFAYEGECVEIFVKPNIETKIRVLKNDFINGVSNVVISTEIEGVKAYFTAEVSNRLVKDYNPKKVSCD